MINEPLVFRPQLPLGDPRPDLKDSAEINGSFALQSNASTTPGSITFPPSPAVITEPFCEWILYEDIKETR